MPSDNNVNIKLEVFKEKFTGKLSIIAHFIHSAPNVYKEQEDYIWFPTNEEKNFLIEAFDLTSTGLSNNYNDKKNISYVSDQSVKPEMVSNSPRVTEPNLNFQGTQPHYANKNPVYQDEQKNNNTVNYQRQQQTTPTNNQTYTEEIKKNNKPNNSYFQDTQTSKKEPTVIDFSKDVKTYETKKDIQVPETYYKQKQGEMKKDQQNTRTDTNKTDINSAVIAQADLEAIDAALKKHTDKEDYMVQADEKTIIDKVISQKKKGKWVRSE